MSKSRRALSMALAGNDRPAPTGARGRSSCGAGLIRLLLTSSSLIAVAALGAPAFADNCDWAANCTLHSTGGKAGDGQGDGQKGGDGGNGSAWTWLIDRFYYVERDDATGAYSPLDVKSDGGDGGQGTNGHGSHGDGGGGGKGGDGNNLNVRTGVGSWGTTTGGASGITIATDGGMGGGAAYGKLGYQPGTSGDGGKAGNISADLSGTWPDNTQKNSSRAIDIWSLGGAGGDGQTYKASWIGAQSGTAPNGGNGGGAGTVDVRLNGTFQANRGGVRIQSYGGAGGQGGNNHAYGSGQGGNGGHGGDGNAVQVTVDADTRINQHLDQDAGLMVISAGGAGGHGGPGVSGGSGGAGGNAGDVTITLSDGAVIKAGGVTGSPGILAQSLGGVGGNGSSTGFVIVGPQGGSGANGGKPGNVTITGSGTNIQSGNVTNNNPTIVPSMAPGVLAQSIGGGGGKGGGADGAFAVGGYGGNAISGGNVSVSFSNSAITSFSQHSEGIAAQSIGGGGGKGGDAHGVGSVVNMVIGGSGGAGGQGGTVHLNSGDANTIATNGAHSHGLLAQAIGGGGGIGGAAYSKAASVGFAMSLSLGGSGGAGGHGGIVELAKDASGDDLPTNSGRVRTYSSDSNGILVQSIGGGGGAGGASTASAQAYGGGNVPAITMAVAFGGAASTGGDAGSATGLNTGLIQTAGSGSSGIVGQAIGGGGGIGGDASASGSAKGGPRQDKPLFSLSASFAFGGAGGAGGAGGYSTITNQGFILTTGESGDGMLSQSIGGGGGAGGSGDAKSDSDGEISISISNAMGGNGAKGGVGSQSLAVNDNMIITLGDGASGVVSQSIGGGGGKGGGAAASAKGEITASQSIGGNGAEGGTGATAIARNTAEATIVTYGADANGLFVQSIGGGGGSGGKTGTSLGTKTSSGDGGTGDVGTVQDVITDIDAQVAANGLNWLKEQYSGVTGALALIHKILGTNTLALDENDLAGALDDIAQLKGETDDDNDSKEIHLTIGVGGSAGWGGNSGAAEASNDGAIATMGHHADAILVQSVAGGGGKGGAASTATSDKYEGSLSVGGTGGPGGASSTAKVTNTGTLHTTGALAAGIVAQSISGGGGIGGASASSVTSSSKDAGDDDADDGYFTSVSLSLGGNGGQSNSSGQVMVDSSGAIVTQAHDAIGILAQSIAGGGGILKTMATDLEGAGGSASAKGTDHTIALSFGGSGGKGVPTGQGSGYVRVSTTQGGAITTSGENSYGILAQTISGGGGVALGGRIAGRTANDFFGSGTVSGSVINNGTNDRNDPSANSGLFVEVGDAITTSGAGAVGVFAQSIGGGGGVAGDIGATMQKFNIVRSSVSGKHSGNGGAVYATVGEGAKITTTGLNAPGMILQSIGGGGGWFANHSGAYAGSMGGTGSGAPVMVTVNGTVDAQGAASSGIIVQSTGGGENGGNPAGVGAW